MKTRIYGTEQDFELLTSQLPMKGYLMDAPEGVFNGDESLIAFETQQNSYGEDVRVAVIDSGAQVAKQGSQAAAQAAADLEATQSAAVVANLKDACGGVSSLTDSQKDQLLEDILLYLGMGHG